MSQASSPGRCCWPMPWIRSGAPSAARTRTAANDFREGSFASVLTAPRSLPVYYTIFVHTLAMAATINLVRHEEKLGHTGASALIDPAILAVAISFAFVAHLIEIALWAALV